MRNLIKHLIIFLLLISAIGSGVSAKKMWFDSYSQETGLPFNQILCINQDLDGWIWIGTNRGLSRFDGYRFKNFLPSTNDSISIKGLLVRTILTDRKGNLWVGTENGGLNVYRRETETFEQPFKNNPTCSSIMQTVLDIEEDKNGNLWLGTRGYVLKIDPSNRVTKYAIYENDRSIAVKKLEFDRSGRLWIGTSGDLYLLDFKKNTIRRFETKTKIGNIYNIMDLVLDSDGDMWVTTGSMGAFLVNTKTLEVKPIVFFPFAERSKAVRKVTEDKPGIFWIGTRGGLYIYNKASGMMTHYVHDEREQQSLKDNSVNTVFRDRNGDMWIGTRQGLSLCARSKQVFSNYEAHPSDKSGKYLNSESVYALWMDKAKNIWIGTEDGGINIYNPSTQSYQYIINEKGNTNSLSENCIKAFLEDKKGNLWIGTFHGGIDVMNLQNKRIRHYRNNPTIPSTLVSNDVWDFTQDSQGTIWIATSSGVDKYDSTSDSFVHCPELSGKERINWIDKDSHNNIWMGSNSEVIIYNTVTKKINRHKEYTFSFLEDSKGRYWITSFDKGLAEYSINDGAIAHYRNEAGLAHNQFLNVLEDNDQKLWISSSDGLMCFDPENHSMLKYNKKDGIQNSNFNYGAAFKSTDGELFFGGISGFTHFNPSEIVVEKHQTPLVITELKVLNRKIETGSHENNILKKSISVTDLLTLGYKQNAFSVEFASLNFTSSESNQYSYYLEGLDEEWSDPSINRIASYTNIDPGYYVLKICSVINGERQTDNIRELIIKVTPPFWRTYWFLFLVIIGLGWFTIYIIHSYINRKKTKMELVIERMRTNKLNELNNLKLKFFTNISHEIRTPLTLILTPLEKLHSKDCKPEEISSYVDMMYKNTKDLNKLINQLLDFRKLDSGGLKLELLQGDIVQLVSESVNSYVSIAKEKSISMTFNCFQESLIAQYDADKIGMILNNLLSNAIKFTEKNGRITVHLTLAFDTNVEATTDETASLEWIEISVTDTGIGISENHLSKIFDPFYQIESKNEHTGTGIGLSFANELVKLHHGELFVESKIGIGSKFAFRIPYKKEIQRANTSVPNSFADEETFLNSELERILLIVEDNSDVRLLIKNHFNDSFHVYEAENGKEGWIMTLKIVPDVIISDVLMAEMNGFDFCKKVKNDERTSHIPFLLLTALHSKEHIIKGLENGADDYITKPFDLTILQSKIENIISIRDSYKEKFSAEVTLQPKNILIASPDQKFLQKAIDVVEIHISDSELDIEKFAVEVGLSRMQLYRKLHALTDMTVKEFIRNIRLKRAAQLLIQDSMNITEIAYAVGFKDVSHFGKCFRQVYGISAKEYKNSLVNE